MAICPAGRGHLISTSSAPSRPSGDAPHRSISTKDVAIAAQFKQGKTISGRGIFLVPLSEVNPETGEMSPATCYAHACLVADALGMTTADTERFLAPPPFERPTDPVPQAAINPHKPQMGYPPKQLAFMVAMCDDEIAAAASTPDPPVLLERS